MWETIKNKIKNWVNRKPHYDHIYYPSYDSETQETIGQVCVLCNKFNKIEDVIPNYREQMTLLEEIRKRK